MADTAHASPAPASPRRLRLAVMGVVAALALLAGGLWWHQGMTVFLDAVVAGFGACL